MKIEKGGRIDGMKTALVTGASRGIGFAIAQKFLSEGYFVIGTSKAGATKINSENFISFSLDLSSKESIEETSQAIINAGYHIDVLVNNAGVLHEKGNPVKIEMETLRSTLEVNLFGTIDFTEHLLPLLNNGAYVVNISSQMASFQTFSLGERSAGSYPSYRISKAALNMYTHALSGRLGEKATILSIDPGWVKTDMGGPLAERYPEEVAEDIYSLVNRKIETGKFWHKGEIREW